MEASQRTSHIVLTKCTLLVLCVHLCAALDYYSFYEGLTVKDIAQTLPLSTICECHNACKAIVNCTAATHVDEPRSEPKCLISETREIVKNDLASGNVDSHTTIIKGYQVKFVNEPKKFTDAKQACKDMGMRLATPSDAAARDLLAKIHKKMYANERDNDEYWVDLTKTGNKWTWGDRVEVTSEVGADPWVPGYPKWDWACGRVKAQDTFVLMNLICSYTRHYICTP